MWREEFYIASGTLSHSKLIIFDSHEFARDNVLSLVRVNNQPNRNNKKSKMAFTHHHENCSTYVRVMSQKSFHFSGFDSIMGSVEMRRERDWHAMIVIVMRRINVYTSEIYYVKAFIISSYGNSLEMKGETIQHFCTYANNLYIHC